MKENPDLNMFEQLPQVTKLVPRLNCMRKYSGNTEGDKSIMELFRQGEF